MSTEQRDTSKVEGGGPLPSRRSCPKCGRIVALRGGDELQEHRIAEGHYPWCPAGGYKIAEVERKIAADEFELIHEPA
jgi:hypothetical protein